MTRPGSDLETFLCDRPWPPPRRGDASDLFADRHLPPLDDPADAVYLEPGDPRRPAS